MFYKIPFSVPLVYHHLWGLHTIFIMYWAFWATNSKLAMSHRMQGVISVRLSNLACLAAQGPFEVHYRALWSINLIMHHCFLSRKFAALWTKPHVWDWLAHHAPLLPFNKFCWSHDWRYYFSMPFTGLSGIRSHDLQAWGQSC